MGDQRERQCQDEADADGDRRQHDVLEERRRERVVPVLANPVGTERVVSPHARAPMAEGRDHGSGGNDAHNSAPASLRWKTPEHAFPLLDEHGIGVALEHQRHGVAKRRRRGSGHRRLETRHVRLQRHVGERAQREAPQRAVVADELRDELVGGMRQDRVRRVVLRQHATLAENRDPIAHPDRLVDVVGDEDHRLADLAMQAAQLVLQTEPRDRIERAERLVHQQERRVCREGPREPDPLTLPARQLGRVPLGVARLEPDELQQLVASLRDPFLVPAEEPRHDADVVRDGHVREEADLLDHVADATPQLDERQVTHGSTVDPDVSRVERDQPVDHLEGGRLAATRGSDQHTEGAGRDLERQVVERRLVASGVALRDVVEDDLRRSVIRAHLRFLIPASPMAPPAATRAAVIAIDR